ncbi:COG1361 family protein [Tenggerimyces flavus]|uniref:Uncharacterized protein n=1 Tax=Tenggerimyces flavus TaxID=1708749 RepID=A0ABV7YID0_9ACTN|nr:hypothetical protein [Tenggerimyces flavus]MBM7784720.1 hypothetical protein [Tenggerimyces flavus]
MISQEVWAAIPPRHSPRRHLVQALVIVAVMIALAVTAWWSGAATARLSATPVAVEPGAPGQVLIRVELRNDGQVAARPSSFTSESTPPVRGVEPHATPIPESLSDAESVRHLPAGWTLRGRETRAMTLDLRIACDAPPPKWRLRMVTYVRGNGSEVDVSWIDDKLPDWRTRALTAACPE